MRKTETIYNDVPVPEKRRGRLSKWEKFKNMEVGECVFVSGSKDRNALLIYLKRNGISVVTRKAGEEAQGALDPSTGKSVDHDVFGVWRVDDE